MMCFMFMSIGIMMALSVWTFCRMRSEKVQRASVFLRLMKVLRSASGIFLLLFQIQIFVIFHDQIAAGKNPTPISFQGNPDM